jgi:hypothetical protein
MARKPKTQAVSKLRDENSELKAENRRLKRMSQAPAKKSRPLRRTLRSSGIILLIAFAVALLTVANLLFWFGNTVVKQDRFVAATAPIIKDPVIQHDMSLYVTNNIFNNVDVQQTVEQVLPPRADFLAPQLTGQLKNYTQTTLQKILANPKVQDTWNQTLAKQHQRLINFASNYQGSGNITVNDFYNQLDDRLANTKLAFLANKKLPAKIGEVTVVNATWLPAFHNLVVHIDTWRLITLILFLVSIIAAVWLSRNRRRTLYIFSVASAAFMLATLLALHVTKGTIISKPDPQYQDGVQHIIQIVFHSLVLQTVTILAATVLLGIVTWISGTSKGALVVKNQFALLFSGRLHKQLFGEEAGTIVGWVQRYKRVLEWTSVALITALMLLVRLTLKSLLLYALLLLVVIAVIEVVGGQSRDRE